MIPAKDLVEIKQRLITAADAARRIATSPDQFVLYDEEQYEAVVGALVASKDDLLRVFAELDVFRGMFADRMRDFFMEGVSHGDDGDSRVDVAAVQDGQDQRDSEEVRKDDAATGSGVPAGGANGKRPRRSKPRRNKAADSPVQGGVGRADGEGQMDGSEATE